jgi:3-methyladenine DNA glycosylase AlkD
VQEVDWPDKKIEEIAMKEHVGDAFYQETKYHRGKLPDSFPDWSKLPYQQLIESFYEHKNAEQARMMSAYMKNNFPFLGIPKPRRAELQKEFLGLAKKQIEVDWAWALMLWDLPEREFQYLAVEYLRVLNNILQKSDIDRIKTLIITKSWWDTVDSLAENITGVLCAKDTELIQSHLISWAKSDNIWLVRIAILFQLKYKDKTDAPLLAQIIDQNSDSKEFFVAKAIGWALREYSKTNKEWVRSFLQSHNLQPLSVREAVKYL